MGWPDCRLAARRYLIHEATQSMTTPDARPWVTSFAPQFLESDRRGQLEAHVAGGDVCARFGGRFGELVARLRSELLAVSPIPAEVRDRLAARLASLE